MRVPVPMLIDVTPPLEIIAEIEVKAQEAAKAQEAVPASLDLHLLPLEEEETDIAPAPIVNPRPFDAGVLRTAGSAELIVSLSLSGACLCPTATARLTSDSSGRGGGVRVPIPSLLDLTPPSERDVSAAADGAMDVPEALVEEIQMAAELADEIAKEYDVKLLSLNSLLRATSSIDTLMAMSLVDMPWPEAVLACPIASARLCADGQGGGGVRVAPPTLVDMSAAGPDRALLRRTVTTFSAPLSPPPSPPDYPSDAQGRADEIVGVVMRLESQLEEVQKNITGLESRLAEVQTYLKSVVLESQVADTAKEREEAFALSQGARDASKKLQQEIDPEKAKAAALQQDIEREKANLEALQQEIEQKKVRPLCSSHCCQASCRSFTATMRSLATGRAAASQTRSLSPSDLSSGEDVIMA